MSVLTSYLVAPKKVHFETQGQDEKILLLLRKHPITQAPWIAFAVFFLLVPLIGIPLLLELEVLPNFVTGGFLAFIVVFWYVIIFGYAFVRFLLWFFNVNIVTDQRIVDIDFPHLLFKESTATRISQIEDITHRRGGFARTIFDFGDVFVQTAGAMPNIEFLDIPRPNTVVRRIVDVWQEKRPEKARSFFSREPVPRRSSGYGSGLHNT